jgi:putative ABC transport system permease protein
MNRFVPPAVAVLVVLAAALLCGCERTAPPATEPSPAEQPRADQPKSAIVIVVRSVRPPGAAADASKAFVLTYGLTHGDLELVRKVPGVAAAVPVRFIPSEVRLNERLAQSRVVGTAPEYAEVFSLKVSAGRQLTDKDGADKENVCVIGAGVGAKLFPDADPLGKSVTIRRHDFRVVGVLAKTGGDADNDVYMPLQTADARLGEVIFQRTTGSRTAERVELNEIIARVADPTKLAEVADAVREALKKSHPKQDWEVVMR